MIRSFLPALCIASLSTLAPSPAAAVPVTADLAIPAIAPRADAGPSPRHGAILPTGPLLVLGESVAVPRSSGQAPLLTLPLPGSMPHFVVALGGLVLVARRRRGPRALAGTDRAN